MPTQAERLGRNESLFREVNERIAELNHSFEVEGRAEFLCECSRGECKEPISISMDEYEAVRKEPTWFFVLPGHEDGRVERIVTSDERYSIVEKIGGAGEEAEELDPRS
jgi:hypothetical protein